MTDNDELNEAEKICERALQRVDAAGKTRSR